MEKERLGRAAWISLLGPADSKAAYCSRILLPRLESLCEVETFSEISEKNAAKRSYPFAAFSKRNKEAPYKTLLFQIEDLAEAAPIRSLLLQHPGPVWFHDVYSATAALQGGQPFFQAEAEQATSALFSMERNATEFARRFQGSSKRTALLPYPVNPELLKLVPSVETKTVLFSGGPAIEDRAFELLSAIEQTTLPLRLLWVIAEAEKPEAEELLGQFMLPEVELLTGRSPALWEKLLPRSSVSIHTRYSAFGDPGPYLAQSLMAGLAVVVTDFGAASSLPRSAVHKIMPGVEESRALASGLEQLLSPGSDYYVHLSTAGRNYARELHHADVVLQELLSVLY